MMMKEGCEKGNRLGEGCLGQKREGIKLPIDCKKQRKTMNEKNKPPMDG